MSIRRGKRCPRAGLRVRHSGGDTGVVTTVPTPTGKAVTCVNAGKTSLVYVKLDSGQTIGLPRVELSNTKRTGGLGALADIFRVTTKTGAAPPFEVGKVMDVVPGDYLAADGEVALKRTEFTSPRQLEATMKGGLSGLGSSDAEHATEFENARHELIGAVSDAERHLNSGMCRAAGALIDEAYVQYGRMRAEAMDAKSMAAAIDMHKTIRSVDEPFERKCVRAEPVSETYEKSMRAMRPGLAGVGDVAYPTRSENAVLLGLPEKVVKRAKRSR